MLSIEKNPCMYADQINQLKVPLHIFKCQAGGDDNRIPDTSEGWCVAQVKIEQILQGKTCMECCDCGINTFGRSYAAPRSELQANGQTLFLLAPSRIMGEKSG